MIKETIYSSSEAVENYRASPNISQSMIKGGSKDNTDAMSFGALVDDYVTMGDDFYSKYVVSTLPEVQPAFKQLVKYSFDCIVANKETLAEHIEDKILSYLIIGMKVFNVQSKWTDETRVSKMSELIPNVMFMLKNIGKIVISKDEIEKLEEYAYMIEGCIKEIDSIEYAFGQTKCTFQVPLFGEFKGIKTKGLLDCVIAPYKGSIAENECVIIDIKCTHNVAMFAKTALDFRYDVQISFYRELMESYGVTVRNCYIIACDGNEAVALKLHETDLLIGKFGISSSSINYVGSEPVLVEYKKKGWIEMLHDYIKPKKKPFRIHGTK